MKFKKPLSVLVGCAAIFVALIVVDELEPEAEEPVKKQKILAPVSILEVTSTQHESTLIILGLTAARWPIQLKASSSAQLKWLNETIEPGQLVNKGDVLARLDNSAVDANLAQALSALKQAELEFKQAKHEQTVALKMLNPKKVRPLRAGNPKCLLRKPTCNKHNKLMSVRRS